MAHRPRLPCPKCSYDLVGLFRDDDTARCPECGRTSSLSEIARVLEQRARWWQGPLAFLLVFVGLSVLSQLPLPNFSLDGQIIDWLFALLIAAAAYFAAARWLELSGVANLSFALGTGVLFILTSSRPTFAGLFLLWFTAFAIASFLVRWREIGDRW